MSYPVQYNFLIIEQDLMQRQTIVSLLKERGYKKIVAAKHATEAFSMVKHLGVNFIISSWDLTEMSGLALLKIIRADTQTSQIPFLLLVEDIKKSQVIEAGAAGVNGIITRPFSQEILWAKIEAVARDDEDARTKKFDKLYDQGLQLVKDGQYEQALDVFKNLLNVYENAEIYYNMGYIKTAQGRYEEALIAFRKATMIDNAHALAFRKMSEVYMLMGRANESQECAAQSAQIYLEKRMEDEAEEVLTEAINHSPATINIYNTLGILYRQKGQYMEAIKYYRKALRVHPEDENIHYNLAKVYAAEGTMRFARNSLHEALQLRPDFEEAAAFLKSIDIGGGLD